MCKAFEETRNEGIAKGREEERLENIRSFVKKLNLSAEQVMNVMNIPPEEQTKYLAKL